MVAIDDQLLDYLLNLAKIPKSKLNDNKRKKLQTDLSGILNHIDRLNQVKTDKVDILVRPYDLSNIGHNDEVKPSLRLNQYLKKRLHKGYFQISQLIDKDKDETI